MEFWPTIVILFETHAFLFEINTKVKKFVK